MAVAARSLATNDGVENMVDERATFGLICFCVFPARLVRNIITSMPPHSCIVITLKKGPVTL